MTHAAAKTAAYACHRAEIVAAGARVLYRLNEETVVAMRHSPKSQLTPE
jgi:hypothetical protein